MRDKELTALEIGNAADFIVTDRDVFTINQISQTQVLSTWLDGEEINNNFDFVSNISDLITLDYAIDISPNLVNDYISVSIKNSEVTTVELYI